jgi:paraquat-inducible protein B
LSRRADPTLVGAFVVGALVLLIAGIVVFGSGRFFKQSVPVLLNFEGNVNGLDVGAPVKFRGVEVGRVKRIRLRFEPTAENIDIPVLIELDQDQLESAGVEVALGRTTLHEAVKNGLRARLESQSLVTGLLFVQLDFYPDQEGHVGEEQAGLPVIPTLPTALEEAQTAFKQILRKLDEIDFAGLIDAFTDAAEAARELLGSSETESTISSINNAVRSVQRLTDTLNRDVGPLSESLQKTSKQTNETVQELEAAARSVRDMLDPESPFSVRLTQTLQELTAAARSMRQLADTLDQNPSSLVRGRSTEPRKP